MAAKITIQLENPHDPVCLGLIQELTKDLGRRYDQDEDGAFSPDQVTVPRAGFLVARVDGDPAGCGALRPFSDTQAEIKRMYVKPAYRGQGIARRLLTRLEDLAAEFGYHEVILETGTRQPEAISLYESAGYARIDCYKPYQDDSLSVCYRKTIKTARSRPGSARRS